MSRIQRNPKLIKLRIVESALHIIYTLRDEFETQLCVPEEVVEEGVRGFVTVIERRMWRSGVVIDRVALPLGDIVMGDGGVVLAIRHVASSVGDLSHGFDADDSLDGEIGLVWS